MNRMRRYRIKTDREREREVKDGQVRRLLRSPVYSCFTLCVEGKESKRRGWHKKRERDTEVARKRQTVDRVRKIELYYVYVSLLRRCRMRGTQKISGQFLWASRTLNSGCSARGTGHRPHAPIRRSSRRAMGRHGWQLPPR